MTNFEKYKNELTVEAFVMIATHFECGSICPAASRCVEKEHRNKPCWVLAREWAKMEADAV